MVTNAFDAVVRPGEKLAQLEFFQLVNQARVLGGEFSFGVMSLRCVRFFGGELLQGFEILRFAFELDERE